MVKKTGFRIQDLGFRARGSEFGVGGSGFGPRTSDLRLRLAALLFLLVTCHSSLVTALRAQQPQAQAGQEIFPVNAKFVQGFGPGYWPTAGSNLTLNLAPGTAVCSNVVRTYAGGTLTLAASATNYVYLNAANNCAPGSNTTGFATGNIPIATVATTNTAISSIADVRTLFVSGGATSAGTVTSVGMTGDGIIFSPTVSGSPITSSGTLAPQLLTQTANSVLAGPGSGPAATPTFRALGPADLPASISSNTTGNAATATTLASSPTQCGSNTWATGVSSSGNANCLQPGFSSLSGTATVSQGGTGQTNAPAAFTALSPLSTEGDLLYYHSSANARLAAGGNGQCLVSNGTDPIWGSCSGSSSFAWSSLVNPAASLTLSMSAYGTTFNHTSPVNWTWANTTAATSGTAQSSPLLNLSGAYWNGSASATDSWSLQDVVASGTNGNSALTLAHTGSTGTATLSVPNLTETSTTQYGVLYGGGSSSPVKSTAAGTSGLPLLGQGSAAPAFGTLGIAGGGTGQTTTSAAFNALSPLTTEGDLHYYHSNSNARLSIGSSGLCLTSNGTDPVWGSCGSGGGSSTGLGNGTTVIDASLQPGVDFSTKVNTAISDCSPGPCTFDLRGFTGSQTMSQNIQFPANSDVMMGPTTINMASGTQFLLSNSVHIHGATSGGYTSLIKTNTTNDYTPVIYGALGNSNDVEIDHIWIGPTTSAGPELPVTSVSASSGGNAVYTGTFSTCGSNACAGFEFGVWGFQGTFNEGYFTATASTTTTLTLNNAGATAETAPTNVPGGTFAVQSGGWGIAAPLMGSHLHDIFSESDLGIKLVDSGCGCYNDFENLEIWSGHGALYLGVSTASLDARSIVAWATDDNSVGYAAASGYGVRALNGSSIKFDGLDIENTKYSIVLKTGGFQVDNFYLENDHTIGLGLAAEASLPILMQGAHGVKLPPGIDVVDLSNSGGPSFGRNVYGSSAGGQATQIPNPVYASLNLTPISVGGYSGDATVGQGSGSTPYNYWMVAVDGSGNKTAPIAYNGVPLNQTLGPYTLTLTAASAASGGLTTYTGTITGGASGGLNNNSFTISGFTNSGNNGTFSCPTSTSTTLVCSNSGGVAETHSGSAASDAYNIIKGPFAYTAAGIKCIDILKGTTSQSLATCVPPSLFPLYDDGSVTLQAYTAPTRNGTGDAYVPGKLSTAKNVLDDASGNITAGGKITSGPSTSSAASFNTPAGTAPTSPAAGDHWYDGDRVYVKDAETNSGVVSSIPRRWTITSAVTASSTSAVMVGTFAVAASKTYCLMCQLFIQSNNTSNKPTLLVSCPSSPTASQFGFVYLPTATTVAESAATCGTAMVSPTATGTASTTFGGNSLTGMLQNGTTAGSLTVQVESSGSYNTIIEPGSYCILY